MIKIKVDGESKQIPTRWKDVTFRQWVQLAKAKNNWVESVAVFLGVTPDEINKSNFTEGMDVVVEALNFMVKLPEVEKYPTWLGPYALGNKITTFPQLNAILEQTEIIAKAYHSGDIEKMTEPLAEIAAIYCQGVTEPFDKEKAGYLAKQFMDYPCGEIIAVGEYYSTMACAASSAGKVTQDELRKGRKYYKGGGFFQRLWHSLS